MTLWRQLSIVMVILLASVFAGTFMISIYSMHRYLINQMSSHAQDTATSLGLSVSKPFAAKDFVTVARIIDAIFDRGYYQQIMVKDVHNKVIYNNINREEVEAVPEWFVRLVDFPEQTSEALIVSGWRNAGNVYVTSNPGYAYFELWKICKDNFWWFFGCILIILFGSLIILHELLRPLRYVAEQAEAITNRNFLVQDRLPFTTEFRVVVETMNKMSINLKEMFDRHVEFSALMRERAYKDMVTGLGNRRYFDSQLEQMLSSYETSISGGLFLVRLTEMGKYRSTWGYQLGDVLLKDVASVMTQLLNEFDIPVLCYFGNYEFAVVILNVGKPEAEAMAAKLLQRINDLEHHEYIKDKVVACIGGVIFTHANFSKDILSKADAAMRDAQAKGANQISIIEDIKQAVAPVIIDDWRKFLQDVITEQAITFQYQPVYFYEKNATLLFHHEALLRLKGPHRELLPSGTFLPKVEELGFGVEFDKMVIDLVLDRISDNPEGGQRYAINLSKQAVLDENFYSWASERFARFGVMANRLNFEIPQYVARKNLAAVKKLFTMLQLYRIQVGLDHFGRGFSSFGYLSELPLDYIKIDGSYVRGIEDLTDNQMIIRSFVEMGHGLGIVVIATAVETEAEREILMKLHVDGMQGYFIGQPA